MPVIEMGEIVTDERERNKSQKKTGNKVTVVTLKDVEKIKELADAIHARGGKVVGTCVVCNPWLLDKLEPYCDALTIQYTVSAVALNNALNAQVDVISCGRQLRLLRCRRQLLPQRLRSELLIIVNKKERYSVCCVALFIYCLSNSAAISVSSLRMGRC